MTLQYRINLLRRDIREFNKIIRRDGLIIETHVGPRVHPAVIERRQSLLLLHRLEARLVENVKVDPLEEFLH